MSVTDYPSSVASRGVEAIEAPVCVLQAGFSQEDAAWLQARIGAAMPVQHVEPTQRAVEAALTPQVKMVIVQFDIRQDLEAPVRLTQWLRQNKPDMPVLGMGYANTPKVPLAALRGGTHDFLDMAGSSDEQLKPFWSLSMRSAAHGSSNSSHSPVRKGKAIALLGARPGMGVSTLAVHLAAALAQASIVSRAATKDGHKQKMPEMGVGLLDLGFPLRDGLLHLGLQSSFDMVDAIQSMHRLDPALLEAALPRHRSGSAVLPWPSQSQAMRDVDPRATSAMVQRLREFFGWQVVDVGGLPSADMVQAAAQSADHVWAVCDQSVGGIVSFVEMLKSLPERDGGKPLCDGLIVNRVISGAGMAPEDIARRVGLPLLGVLPQRDVPMLQASSQGKLLSETDPSDPYVTKVREMAGHVVQGVDLASVPAASGWKALLGGWRSKLHGASRSAT